MAKRVSFTPILNSKDMPANDNRWYISSSKANAAGKKGVNTAILGSRSDGTKNIYLNVLPNCVGYAAGRFTEIYYYGVPTEKKHDGWKGKSHFFKQFTYHDAGQMMEAAKYYGFKTSSTPSIGAMMVWSKPNGYGHVAIVEKIIPAYRGTPPQLKVSQSGYNSGTSKDPSWDVKVSTFVSKPGSAMKWVSPDNYTDYIFEGFIINPASAYISDGTPTLPNDNSKYSDPATVKKLEGQTFEAASTGVSKVPTTSEYIDLSGMKGGAVTENQAASLPSYNTPLPTVANNTKTNKDNTTNKHTTGGANLLSYPSLVESPFISVKFGDYTFGTYSESGGKSAMPNYMKSIDIVKTNGTINQYTLVMEYQIRDGDDPNYLDKVFGKVGYGGKIYISYGDWTSPAFTYRNEEAIVTKILSNVDFASSRITYTISATSAALATAAGSKNWPAIIAKPSDLIISTLLDKSNGLYNIFTGMTNATKIRSNNLIASNDKVVEIPAKQDMSPLQYINFLVTCMVNSSNTGNNIIKNSTYFLNIVDSYDSSGMGGTYFKVTEVSTSSGISAAASTDTYSVDIGYPGDNMVTNFQLNNDTSYSLLYEYSDSLQNQNYVYNIDNNGNITTNYSPGATTSTIYNKTVNTDANWWTLVTQFPITATLTIKGLVRPAMLMTYIKVNALFFGKRHMSSGVYVVTKQEDIVDGSGYRTILTLLRVSGE